MKKNINISRVRMLDVLHVYRIALDSIGQSVEHSPLRNNETTVYAHRYGNYMMPLYDGIILC